MSSAKSTRLAIVEQSLADILERLSELSPNETNTVKLRELRTKALAYDRTVRGWTVHPPSEAQRSAMLKLVLELNVQVMQVAREAEGPPPETGNVTGYVPRSRSSKPKIHTK
jgi:hypothetical protein